ncbi:hypothetical protein [Aquamicrobium defluvii]|uniref:Uncharacterized protein n=1 Tax=Aquamicrobium defluvii TaxID=69279 RepID=A0A4R6Y471_9HYPH|nr:hypothetical protein [Aquamicrobium defluvii]TDR27815.1 hypothetical protein DES43_1645 [Aquamicrobium defluvii]
MIDLNEKALAVMDAISDIEREVESDTNGFWTARTVIAAIRAYLEAATPPDELSGNPGELIDKMADAIRGDTVLDDTPWETLSEDRKVGWRGDAERALAVVKEYLTSQAATALRLSAGGGVPEGWKLVPVDPTPEMLGAFWRQKNCGTQEVGERGPHTDDCSAYRAMLAASPTVEAGHVE